LPSEDYRYMEMALRQHLPRSPIWKYLKRWEQLLKILSQLEEDLRGRIKYEVEQDSRLNEISAAAEVQAISGAIEFLVFQGKTWAQGLTGLNMKENFKVKPIRPGIVNVSCGFAQLGDMQEKHAKDIYKVMADFESKIKTWEQFQEMQKSFVEKERVKSALQDELATIYLRRIIPGKCKFCPL
jgi:hypothetical protein